MKATSPGLRRRVSCVFNYCGDTIIALNSSSGMCVASSMNGFIILVSIPASSPQLSTPLHSPDLECPELSTESHNSSWKIYMYKDSWGRLVDIHVYVYLGVWSMICLYWYWQLAIAIHVFSIGAYYGRTRGRSRYKTLSPSLLCPAVRLKCSPSNQSARTRVGEFSNFRTDVFWLHSN